MIIVQLDSEQLNSLIQNAVRSAISETQPTQRNEAPDLLTVQQAAEFLSLSVPTIYAKISNKELPCMKRAKRVYFSREDLMTYLRAGRKRTIAEIEAGANNVLKPLKKRGAGYE